MKVISLIEPWGSLIQKKVKRIETRSWSTKYRGELYIHTSQKKINLKDEKTQKLVALLSDRSVTYGAIIAKCQLVDCIYMDEAFLEEFKKNPVELFCGEYQLGRYAWILKDIEPLSNPIYTNGHLGIWTYQPSTYELLKALDPNLTKSSTKIKKFPLDSDLSQQMISICQKYQAYGLALPQLGVFKQGILIAFLEELTTSKKQTVKQFEFLFNPEILEKEGCQEYWEACISCGDAVGLVRRPYRIKLKYQDQVGNTKVREAKGFEAIILDHEIDHLQGILFTEKALQIYHMDLKQANELRRQFPRKVLYETGSFVEEIEKIEIPA